MALCVVVALLDPGLPLRARLAAVAIAALTAWRPGAGLVATAAFAPAGLLLAPSPAHAAELLAWSFLAAWLLPVWRPLGLAAAAPAVAAPALLYGACAFASWLSLTIAGAAGVDPLALPMFLLRSLPAAYLTSSAPAPETWTLLQAGTGLALLFAAAVLVSPDPGKRRAVAHAVAASAAVLALFTVGDVLRQWAGQGYGGPFLLRYVRGERFALHLVDLNAAGSHFVLGGLIAAALAVFGRRRLLWAAVVIAILPALWLTGSRSAAIGAVLVGAIVIPLARGRAVPAALASRARIVAPLAVAIGVVLALVAVARQPAGEGSAARSLGIRGQFLETSARMFASAPLLGVGIGRYHERSSEFMPPALRAVYPYENAHNYFAQQFAELGVIGGGAFVWLVVALLRQGWRGMRVHGPADAALAGLFAGCAGYALTCVTGHPLLVPEAALPFWAAAGAMSATAARAPARGLAARPLAAAAAVILAGFIGAGAIGYVRPARRPPDRGMRPPERTADGASVRRFDAHAVTYVQGFRGVLILPLRAAGAEPATVDVEVAGWNAGRWTVTPGEWSEIEIPLDGRSTARFRRLDLRVLEGPAAMMALPRWRPLP